MSSDALQHFKAGSKFLSFSLKHIVSCTPLFDPAEGLFTLRLLQIRRKACLIFYYLPR